MVLLAVMLFAGVMTQTVPQGRYDVGADGSIINGTYRVLGGARMPLLMFTTSEAATGLLIIVMIVLIGSGTAKAFLVMPLVVPLFDMAGLTRQSMVLAFCQGGGFTNLRYPTSGIILIAIGMVGVSYGRWLRWTRKRFALAGLRSVGLMLPAVATGYRLDSKSCAKID